MLIFGHRFIKNNFFYHINDIDAIKNSPSNSIIFLPFDEENLDIVEYLQKNDISFALEVKNINEILYASALEASFIIVTKKNSKTAQEIANEYIFDAKILVRIKDEEEIADMAILGIDGVLFQNAIIKISS